MLFLQKKQAMITKEQFELLGKLINDVSPDKHYWFFRTMGGQYYDEFVSKGFIAIGYDNILTKDFEDIPEQNALARVHIKYRLHELNKEMTESQTAKAAGQLVRFYKELAIGDIVVVPSYQSRKYAIGVVDSNMYEDNKKHNAPECMFIKRRRVKWQKEIWRNELDAKAILAFSNQQTMSSIDDYADYIDRKISRLYNKGNKTHLILRVSHNGPLSWDDWGLIGDLGAIFKDFSEENNLGVDLTQIEMKVNVQSPGDIMMAVCYGAGILLAVAVTIILCIKSTSFKIQYKDSFKLETNNEGLSNILNAISDFLDRNQDRKIRAKAAEIKLKKMELELPDSIRNIIPQITDETIKDSLYSTTAESEREQNENPTDIKV